MKKYLFIFLLLILPVFTFAQTKDTGLIPCGYDGVECTFNDLITLAQNVINFLIILSVSIATISFAYAGWLYMSARGSSEQVKKATGIFTSVAVGFIIILVAWLAVNQFLTALVDPEFNQLVQ